MNIDMLVFGEDWGSHPSSTQHLISQLSLEQKILWVNSLGLRRPKLNLHDINRAWSKLCAMSASKKTSAPQRGSPHTLINPRSFSWPGNKLARKINQKLLLNQLLPHIRAQNKKPLLWTSLPSAVDVVGKLGERACVYYCGDDFSALAGVDHSAVNEMEQQLVKKCQLVIAASDVLASKFPADKTVTLTHGVNYNLFSSPCLPAADLPSAITAGFYGSISDWLDQRLICQVADILPHWQFVFIGPIHTDVSQLEAKPNVHLLGPRSHQELIRYSQHWNISMLPFINNEQIKSCNPLKLREYLAAGTPVVSTEFPALDGYRDLVHIANHPAMFAQKMQAAFLSHSQQQVKQQQLRVAGESWQAKAAYLQQLLSQI